ncbi:MAG: hypothetical protein LAT55_09915 [Opitutales bacterium]|nr:hypothetical protein [Opitutales bacterium]
MKIFTSSLLLLGFFASWALATSPYGLSPQETYQMVQKHGDEILFIDVRDPVEIQFVGFTDTVDRVIPFRIAQRDEWNEDTGGHLMRLNEVFLEQVQAALDEKGLDEEARIITMCRTGSSRGEPSATYLREGGFPNSYFVINGFQGEKLTEGPHAGWRRKNGWQNSNLPWGEALDRDKVFQDE